MSAPRDGRTPRPGGRRAALRPKNRCDLKRVLVLVGRLGNEGARCYRCNVRIVTNLVESPNRNVTNLIVESQIRNRRIRALACGCGACRLGSSRAILIRNRARRVGGLRAGLGRNCILQHDLRGTRARSRSGDLCAQICFGFRSHSRARIACACIRGHVSTKLRYTELGENWPTLPSIPRSELAEVLTLPAGRRPHAVNSITVQRHDVLDSFCSC